MMRPGFSHPGLQITGGLAAQHVMEALNDIPGFHKVRQPLFDGGNRHSLSLGQVVALEGHQANDGSRGGSMTKSGLSLFCVSGVLDPPSGLEHD